MGVRMEPFSYARDSQFTVGETTKDAVESTRLAVQHRALESAELILAELGIEES